jgi:hypothetical protein
MSSVDNNNAFSPCSPLCSSVVSSLTPAESSCLSSFLSSVTDCKEVYFANQREFLRLLRSRTGISQTPELLAQDENDRSDDFIYESLRFLRANKWNSQQAIKHFREYSKWRVDEKVDFILLDKPTKTELLEKVVPFASFGYSKSGSPVYYELTGSCHVDALIQLFHQITGNIKEISRIHIYQQEIHRRLCREQTKRLGQLVEKCITISDMSGLTVAHRRTVSVFIDVLSIDQKYYPETLEVLYCVNCPRIFPLLFSLVKPFLDAKTVSKIQIFSHNPKEKLLEVIDQEQLAISYGGKMVEPPVFHHSDLSSLLALINENAPESDDLAKEIIKAGKKREISVKVRNGNEFAWFIKTKQSDLAVEISFVSSASGSSITIFPLTRRDAAKFAFTGESAAPEDGSFVVVMDNSFSYFTSKEVHYWLGESSESEIKSENESKQP